MLDTHTFFLEHRLVDTNHTPWPLNVVGFAGGTDACSYIWNENLLANQWEKFFVSMEPQYTLESECVVAKGVFLSLLSSHSLVF